MGNCLQPKAKAHKMNNGIEVRHNQANVMQTDQLNPSTLVQNNEPVNSIPPPGKNIFVHLYVSINVYINLYKTIYQKASINNIYNVAFTKSTSELICSFANLLILLKKNSRLNSKYISNSKFIYK